MSSTKVYLDTSFINYLVASRLPDKMEETLTLWNILTTEERFEIVISEVVEQELRSCYEPKRSRIFDKLTEAVYRRVSETEDAAALADRYLAFGLLSSEDYYDLLHIAHATVNGCHWIVSWNFKHFVNFKTMDLVNAVNLTAGYAPVKIGSPPMFLGELENER